MLLHFDILSAVFLRCKLVLRMLIEFTLPVVGNQSRFWKISIPIMIFCRISIAHLFKILIVLFFVLFVILVEKYVVLSISTIYCWK